MPARPPRAHRVRLGKESDGVWQTVEVQRLQSDGKQLEGVALFAIRDQSQRRARWPTTREHLRWFLPAGAELDSAQAKGAGGQPIAMEATPGSAEEPLHLNYPLRPGETAVPGRF